MAITAAQVIPTKKSRATQAARNTTRIAMTVRVTARARGSKGSPALSTDRSSFLLSMVADWRGGQFRARRHAHSASSLTPAEGYPENISEGGSWRFLRRKAYDLGQRLHSLPRQTLMTITCQF